MSRIETLIKTYFKSYYRNPDRDIQITDIESREFAYQPFGKDIMIRHLSFRNVEDFKKFALKNVPAHVYYSTARYVDPDNPDMERKGWRGADLIFDIDGDHLPTENCKLSADCGAICVECLEDTINETLKLVDILESEFGISRDEYYITFSGHRGFHVHVESEDVLQLSQDERREIVDYLRCVMFNFERFIDQRGRLIAGPDFDGFGSRFWRCIEGRLEDKVKTCILGLKSVRRYLNKIKNAVRDCLNNLSVMIDEIVTLDIKRLIRVPNSLHGKTGLIVSRLDVSDLERGAEHVIEISIPRIVKNRYLKIVLKRRLSVSNVLGVTINNSIDDVQIVPAFVGIYLIRQGLADFVEYED